MICLQLCTSYNSVYFCCQSDANTVAFLMAMKEYHLYAESALVSELLVICVVSHCLLMVSSTYSQHYGGEMHYSWSMKQLAMRGVRRKRPMKMLDRAYEMEGCIIDTYLRIPTYHMWYLFGVLSLAIHVV